MLGNYKTNQHSVELQLMRRFTSDLQLHDIALPEGYSTEENLAFLLADNSAGTVGDMSTLHSSQYLEIVQASTATLANFPQKRWLSTDIYHPGGVMSSEFLEGPELMNLARCYFAMYPSEDYSQDNISAAVQKYSQIKVGNEVLGSCNSRSKRSFYILAKWCGRRGIIDTSCLRPACISHFIKHFVKVCGSMKAHYFAVVNWFEFHPSRHLLGDPVELWCSDLYELFGPASYLPVQRIYSKFVADRQD